MFTVCPKCALTLAVTAADLRAGQGYVRCGRCANVFNALLGLSEESAGGSAQSAPSRAAAPAAPAAASQTAAPSTAVVAASGPTASAGTTDAGAAATDAAPANTATAPLAAAPAPPASSPPALRLIDSPPRLPEPASSTHVEEYRGTGTFETIVLEGDTFLQTEEMVPEEAFDDEVAAVSRRIAAARDEPRESEELDEEIIDFSDFTLPRTATPARETLPEPGPRSFAAGDGAARNAVPAFIPRREAPRHAEAPMSPQSA